MKNRYPRSRQHGINRQSGFSLVELMVAIAVGLLLVAGLAVLFANSSQSSSELDKSIRQMENGRYAVELLSKDIAVAGYYGEVSLAGLTYSSPNACATALSGLGWDNAIATVPEPITGLSDSAITALTCLPNQRPGTIGLVVRRLDTVAVAATSISDGTPYLQSSRCANSTIDLSSINFIFSATGSNFTLRNIDCSTTNSVRRYVTRVYYVADCDECGIDTIPTLKRAELVGTQLVVSPLSQGIEKIALDYGFDTNSSGTPSVFRTSLSGVTGAEDNKWSNVVAVRLYVLSRTTESSAGYSDGKTYSLGLSGTVGPFTDNFKRRAYATTVRINNVAGLREQ